MSYDPYASGSDEPRPGEPSEYDRPSSVRPDQMKARVQGPAVALIIVGILNLLLALLQTGGTVYIGLQSPEEAKKQQQTFMKLLPKEFQDEMEKEQQKQSPEEEKVRSVALNIGMSLVMLLVAILSLLGGIRMLSLRSYALCVAGAVSAAIPCISCSGCCGFGEIIGIWAVVVLLNPDVKAAFH